MNEEELQREVLRLEQELETTKNELTSSRANEEKLSKKVESLQEINNELFMSRKNKGTNNHENKIKTYADFSAEMRGK